MNDRRHHSRVAADARVSVFTQRNGERIIFTGQLNDISNGGLSVFISAELEIGEAVDVQVTLPYSTRITRAKAVVRTRERHRYGLQFVELRAKDHEELARVCDLVALMK